MKTSRLKRHRIPILDRDPSRIAVLTPQHVLREKFDVPEHCVFCFFPDVLAEVATGGREIHRRVSEIGEHSVYETDFRGKRLMVAHPRIGASIAAASLEGAIAMGARKFIACGG